MIDVHCHLEYMEDVDAVVAECKKRNMACVINSVPDPANMGDGIALQRKYPQFVYLCAGFHPHHVSEYLQTEIDAQIALIRDNRYGIVGIGEVGLDYQGAHDTTRQKEVFAQFIDLADELDMPLVVHCRDAFPDTLKLLVEKNAKHVVFHCFSGNEKQLEFILGRPTWYVSFATNVCYTKKHPELAKLTPLSRMLLETDSPWLDPDEPVREKRQLTNRPWKIMKSAELIGKLKGFSTDEVLATTAANARQVFKFV